MTTSPPEPLSRRAQRRARALSLLLPAILAYIPLLLTQPGQVGADTKTYLYLDPSRLLERAPYMWDPHIGMGTVTHQNIGYLWPMGPWYWALESLGLPDWVAQRLWLGTVMFSAAAGVRYLLRRIGWRGHHAEYGILVASVAYMSSPYLLNYSARISVILLPWAALPWLIGLTAQALRHGGWRYPAWFALLVLTVGGTNATALLMVAPAPLLWFVYATWIEREVPARRALGVLARMSLLTLITSLWWMAGLWAQGNFGLPVLRYTETYRTVAEASTAPEVLRGLGYWFFYGRDKLGPWIEPSVEYTNRTLLLALSYMIPIAALASAAVLRWRHRIYFLAILVVGALMAIGAHPWDSSPPLGALFKELTKTDAGLALRSTPRSVPMVVLSLSVFLGAGVAAISERLRRRAPAVTALACLLLLANLPPLWNGTMIANNLKRPEEIPSYWNQAAAYLDAHDDGTRVLEIPGTDFASYRWGNTVDPITPGLIDRPYVARELFTYGSPYTASLVAALDRPLHDDTMDPDALAVVARLMGVGEVVLRSDLQYERYRTARPVPTWQRLLEASDLGGPQAFGEPVPNVAGPEQPMLDEISLALDPDLPDPPPVAVFPVVDPQPIVRAESARSPLVLSGDGAGVVNAAGAEMLDAGQPLFYSAALSDAWLARLLGDGAELLVTDTNRRRARRWGTIQQTTGYTERSGEEPLYYDPTDQRLELFPDAPPDAFTVSVQRGPVTVTASDYGNPVTYTADDRPANAADGDPLTAWRVGAFSDVNGEALFLHFDEPITADHLRILQPVNGVVNRWITEADLVFDGQSRVRVTLDGRSNAEGGQLIEFPQKTFTNLAFEIVETNVGDQERYDGLSGVGVAEIDVAGASIEELIQVPSDLVDRVGDASIAHRLSYLFTRLYSNPQEKVRFDEEVAIRRIFTVPSTRAFAISGEARVSGYLPDEAIDRLVGLPPAELGGITARSSARLNGSLRHRASAAIDGDPSTFWSAPMEDQVGHFLEFTLPRALTIDSLDLEILTDGRHSLPSKLFLEADGSEIRTLLIDDLPEGGEPNSTTTVHMEFQPITGRSFRLAVDGVRERDTVDWHSGADIVLPIAFAEIGMEGIRMPEPATRFDTGCREDLLQIDDTPVPVRIQGTTDEALDRETLPIEICDPMLAREGTVLSEGEHILRTGIGRDLGIDINWVGLDSEIGGRAADTAAERPPATTPDLSVEDRDPTEARIRITGAEEPFWLVLGESYNEGWKAKTEGTELGGPIPIDGFANGWYIDPSRFGSDIVVELEWRPQRLVWAGLAASGLGVLLCLLLALGGSRMRDDPPELLPALESLAGRHPLASRRSALAVTLLVGVVGILNSPPPAVVALPAAAIAYLSLRCRWGERLPGLLAALGLAIAGGLITMSQYLNRHPPDFAWPQQFPLAHQLGLLTIFLLLADVLGQLARWWRATIPTSPARTIEADG